MQGLKSNFKKAWLVATSSTMFSWAKQSQARDSRKSLSSKSSISVLSFPDFVRLKLPDPIQFQSWGCVAGCLPFEKNLGMKIHGLDVCPWRRIHGQAFCICLALYGGFVWLVGLVLSGLGAKVNLEGGSPCVRQAEGD